MVEIRQSMEHCHQLQTIGEQYNSPPQSCFFTLTAIVVILSTGFRVTDNVNDKKILYTISNTSRVCCCFVAFLLLLFCFVFDCLVCLFFAGWGGGFVAGSYWIYISYFVAI